MDAGDAAIIRRRYFEKIDSIVMAKQLHITRQAVDKRTNKIIERIVFCISNCG